MTKKKECIKVIAIAITCLGLFCATFMGINRISLTAAVSQVNVIPHNRPSSVSHSNAPQQVSNTHSAAVSITNQQEEADAFVEPNITVVMPSAAFTQTPGARALSPECAAMLGARYIWDMFGLCIDGETITMSYSGHPSLIRTTWRGSIGLAFYENGDFQAIVGYGDGYGEVEVLTFTLDSITGERIDIHRYTVTIGPPEVLPPGTYAMNPITREMLSTGDFFCRHAGLGQLPEQIETYTQTAIAFGVLHFNQTEVVSAELTSMFPSSEFDDNRNVIGYSRIMVFEVIDSTGRIANVRFNATTNDLLGIDTLFNDMVPGWVYGNNHQGQ